MDEATRQKLSEFQKKRMKKRREQGLKRYWRRKKKEREEREAREKKEKEKKKKLEAKAREKAKNRKKPGRKKKTGPKINWYKRRKAKEEKLKRSLNKPVKPPISFKIMICRNGRRVRTIGEYRTSADAYDAFKKQKEISNEVIFPRALKIYDNLEESIDECIMIQKTDSGPTMIRNEYGKLIEHKTDLDGWEVIDKFRMNVEETFWVWGHDNRKDRKTFEWIYDELIIGDGFGPYEFKRVFVYKNNVLVRFDDGSLSMIICKSDYDSTRLYNALQDKVNKDKVKQVIFVGDRSLRSEETEKLEREIMDMTGWTLKRTRMRSTTYVIKNKD